MCGKVYRYSHWHVAARLSSACVGAAAACQRCRPPPCRARTCGPACCAPACRRPSRPPRPLRAERPARLASCCGCLLDTMHWLLRMRSLQRLLGEPITSTASHAISTAMLSNTVLCDTGAFIKAGMFVAPSRAMPMIAHMQDQVCVQPALQGRSLQTCETERTSKPRSPCVAAVAAALR